MHRTTVVLCLDVGHAYTTSNVVTRKHKVTEQTPYHDKQYDWDYLDLTIYNQGTKADPLRLCARLAGSRPSSSSHEVSVLGL